jgi:hypothetical protein
MYSTNYVLSNPEHDPELEFRWSEERVADWSAKHGWLVGCNFVPHNAINQLEMWQAETFDPFTIDKELSWAAGLGFNTVRVFLHHLLWEQNPAAFLERIDLFLSIADKHGIKTMFVLFDAVWDPFPKLGKQPEPRHNVHNSGWVQCPGFDVLNDPNRYDALHEYVHGIVSHFKNDERVIIWDLFNEPDNMNIASYKDDNYAQKKADLSLQLLKKTIQWVRAIDPIQPITMAPWQETEDWSCHTKSSVLDNYMFTHADVISFHCYADKKGMEKRIKDLNVLIVRCSVPNIWQGHSIALSRRFCHFSKSIILVLITGVLWQVNRKHTAPGIHGKSSMSMSLNFGSMIFSDLTVKLMIKMK